jgi:hypothetical protein
VIDNNQTTWRQFGCFVTAPNTFAFSMSPERHGGVLFHVRLLFGSNLPDWSQ